MGDIGPTRQRYDVLSSDRDEGIRRELAHEPLGPASPDPVGNDGERGAPPQGDAAR